jgi:hypothetical protein
MSQSPGASRPLCGPPGVNEAAHAVVAPAASGLGVRTAPRAANLDSSGTRIVRKGCVVSYHGARFRVQRVRLGYWYGLRRDFFGREFPHASESGLCRQVQVVEV